MVRILPCRTAVIERLRAKLQRWFTPWRAALTQAQEVGRSGAGCLLVRGRQGRGRVKFFNTDRGYGFIAPDGGGSDVFVHVHDVEAAGLKILVADQLVAYEVGPARDGRSKAVNLRLLNP